MSVSNLSNRIAAFLWRHLPANEGLPVYRIVDSGQRLGRRMVMLRWYFETDAVGLGNATWYGDKSTTIPSGWKCRIIAGYVTGTAGCTATYTHLYLSVFDEDENQINFVIADGVAAATTVTYWSDAEINRSWIYPGAHFHVNVAVADADEDAYATLLLEIEPCGIQSERESSVKW